ncbi:hypothetical protein RJ639_045115 [Escallonia herrerae]|uniref:ResB-like domain-containing protein n=1 Tax=Escallonia herrerae TaxID=1293975 RepID=A0AA89B0I7_9ASTE|nr:hypothetical protein RJ639_045115 [Escallonia herrerae]
METLSLKITTPSTSKLSIPRTHLVKSPIFPSSPRNYGICPRRHLCLSLKIGCKLGASANKSKNEGSLTSKIQVPEEAPLVAEEDGKLPGKLKANASGGGLGVLKRLPRKIEVSRRFLSKQKCITLCRWSFLHSGEAIRKQEFTDTLPRASIQDLGVILTGAGYEVFLKGPSLYAFRGLAGRFAPIGVHLALLLIMAGGTLSATGSFKGTVTVPQGLNFVVGDVLGPSGFLSTPAESFSTEVHVNRFSMEYYDSGEVSQFRTDLSLFDIDGKEVMRKTISVNDPLRYGGFTIYQTDWSISTLQVLKNDEGPFNLAMAPLKINGDKKLYGTFLPVGSTDTPNVKGISMLARDLQSIVLYDKEGKFVGVRRPNSKLPIEIDGTKIDIVDAIGSSGLDLKTDPGVPIVYAGFGALMLTTCISFLSHAQIWAFQDGTSVVVGGKTNRAKVEFPDEMNSLLDQVPEIVESSKPKQPDGVCG